MVQRQNAEQAEAAVQRVREEHARDDSSPHGPWCNVCLTPWPCRTYRSTEALSVDTPEKLQALCDRLAVEPAQPAEITEAEHGGTGNAEDCPICRPLIDQPGGVLYPWHCTAAEQPANPPAKETR
jgi:hypothetical protein